MRRFLRWTSALLVTALLSSPYGHAQTPASATQPNYTIRDASAGTITGHVQPSTVPKEYTVQAPDGRITAHVKPNAAGGQTIRAPNGKVLGYVR